MFQLLQRCVSTRQEHSLAPERTAEKATNGDEDIPCSYAEHFGVDV